MAEPTKARRPAARPKRVRRAKAPMAAEGGTREALLGAATELFADDGVDGVSVRDICGRARANVAAIGYHFGSKENLYLEVLRSGMSRARVLMTEAAAAPALDPARRFIRHVRGFCRALLSPDFEPHMAKLMMRELGAPTPALARMIDEFIRPNFEAVRAAIRALAPRPFGEDEIRRHTFSVLGQCTFYRHAAPIVLTLTEKAAYAKAFPKEVADHVVATTFRAIERVDLLALIEETES